MIDMKNSSKKKSLAALYKQFEAERLGHLAIKTQENYTRAAKLIPARGKPVANYKPADIEKLIKHLGPGAYMVARGFLSSLFGFAIQQGLIDHNPVQAVPARSLGAIRRIPRNEVALLTDALEGEARAVLETMYATTQRMGDVLKIKPEDIVDRKLTVVQEKTGNKIVLEIPDCLTQMLLAISNRPGHPIFTVKAREVRRLVRVKREELGLSAYTPHGMRKSASCEAAEGGATEAMLQALLGHKTSRAATIYRMEADQGLLASAAQECRRVR